MSNEGPNLPDLYNAAEYVVDDGPARFILRIGEICDELDELLSRNGCDTWVFVSAYNPHSQPITKNENEARHAELVAKLDSLRFLYFAGYGRSSDDSWPPETSVLIIGIGRKDGIALGREFEQSAIVFGRAASPAELVWC